MLSLLQLFAFVVTSIDAAQPAYEASVTLQASKILPADLLSGPNHRVEETVYNDGYLNTYKVNSKFGTFIAVSTPMLRIRISEINAMVRMERIKGTKEFTSSLKEAGTDTLVGFKNLVTKPVDTVGGAASGLGTAFRRAVDAIGGAKRSDSEDSRASGRRKCIPAIIAAASPNSNIAFFRHKGIDKLIFGYHLATSQTYNSIFTSNSVLRVRGVFESK